ETFLGTLLVTKEYRPRQRELLKISGSLRQGFYPLSRLSPTICCGKSGRSSDSPPDGHPPSPMLKKENPL
ncbi:MAG: hypothetical protein ACI4KN_01395, partial [Gemmiger sp.]